MRTPSKTVRQAPGLGPYLLWGILFGIIITKAEVLSWFRIQEMFRFQSLHMYGIIGSAVAVAAVSVAAIRWLGLEDWGGAAVTIPDKRLDRGYAYGVGGTIFGLGWGLTGACPGPILALIGNGVSVALVMLVAALAGTWTYARCRHHLPH